MHERKKKSQQYKGVYAEVMPKTGSKQIGVLCSWFSSTADLKVFEYTTEADKTEHSFHPLQSYKCTLSQGCFELVEGSSAICSNVVKLDKDKVALITATKATLSTDTLNCITALCNKSKEITKVRKTLEVDLSKTMWVKCGCITLTHQDRNQLSGCSELTDKHINAAQELMRLQFPEIDGLRDTLLQNKPFQQQASCSQILQAIFIRHCHWACVQIMKGSVFFI